MARVDEILLTLPREQRFYGVAHLVLGGLAARLNLTLEDLDDLRLAFDTLLAQQDGGSEVTLRLRIGDGTLEAALGPLSSSVQAELREETRRGVGLRRILDAVVDRVELGEAQDGAWVTMTKRVGTPAVSDE
jgi:serine/threonine-protein kinase RsbW